MAVITQITLSDGITYGINEMYNNKAVNGFVQVDEYPLNANSLCAVNTDNKLCGFVTIPTTSSGSASVISNTKKFKLGCDIYAAGNTYAANTNIVDTSTLFLSKNIDIRYSATIFGTRNLPNNIYSEIYIPIDIDESTSTFTVKYVTVNVSTGTRNYNILSKSVLVAGNYYMLIGYSTSSTVNTMVWLSLEHPIYYFDGTNLIEYHVKKDNDQDSSIADINNHLTLIDGSINIIDTSIVNINNHLTLIDGSINIIDASIINISNNITNINEHLTLIDTSISQLEVAQAPLYINKALDGSVQINVDSSLHADSLCSFNTDGILTGFTKGNGTGAKTLMSADNGAVFTIGTDIFVAGSTYVANTIHNDVSTLCLSAPFDIRYSSYRPAAGTTLIPAGRHNEVYMPVNINHTAGTYTLKLITNSSTNNFVAKSKLVANNFYIYIGYSYLHDSSSQVWLDINHPLYYFDGTNLIEYNAWRNNNQDTSINNISTLLAQVDTSVNNIAIHIGNIDSSLVDVSNHLGIIDNSIYTINIHVNNIDSSLADISTHLGNIDSSLVDVSNHLSNIDSSLVDISTHLGNIDSSLVDASNHFYILDTSVQDLSDNLYKHPVAPYSLGYVAGSAILANSIVYKGKDNLLYPITDTDHLVDMAWGLAMATKAAAAEALVDGNSLLQQGTVPLGSLTPFGSYSMTTPGAYYAYFDASNPNAGQLMPSDRTHGEIDVVSDNSIGMSQPLNTTHIFIGEVYTTQSNKKALAYDFSAHHFKTLSAGKILKIDGLEVSGSSGHSILSGLAVPVTIDASLPIAGEDLYEGSLVYKAYGTNEVYMIDTSTNPLDLEWGIAYCDANTSIGGDVSVNRLLQKCEYGDIVSHLYGDAEQVVKPGVDMYIICSKGYNPQPRGTSYSGNTYTIGAKCISDYDHVKSYASGFGGATYMYLGVINEDGYLALDTANHMFYTLESTGEGITHINGHDIFIPEKPDITDYRNPVVGDASMPTISRDIPYNSIVFKMPSFSGNVGALNAMDSSGVNGYVDPDWGLGVYRGSSMTYDGKVEVRPAFNTVFQQCLWTGMNSEITKQNYPDGTLLYAVFANDLPRANGVGGIKFVDPSNIVSRADMMANADSVWSNPLWYCYVGTVIRTYDASTEAYTVRGVAVDFSAHQFILEDFSTNKILAINGVAVGGADDNQDSSITDVYSCLDFTTDGIYENSLCCFDTSSRLNPFTTSGGTGTKSAATTRKFPIGSEIYYKEGTDLISGTYIGKKLAIQKDEVDIRYTGNIGSNNGGEPLYLSVTVDHEAGTFSPASGLIMKSGFTDGSSYIYLGQAHSGTTMMFENKNPMYTYNGTSGKMVPYYSSVIGDIETLLAAI